MLISEFDIINNTPQKAKSQAVCNILKVCERLFMCNFFGQEFYECLIDDLIDYKSQENFKGVFKSKNTYEVGNIVFHNGSFYCLVGEIDPDEKEVEEPDCSDDWQKKPRFKTDCFQKLWDNCLEVLLSWIIYRKAIPFIHVSPSQTGFKIQKSDGAGGEAVDKTWLNTYFSAADSMIADTRQLVELYIHDNKGTCDFSKITFLQACKPTQRNVKRRFYFRR